MNGQTGDRKREQEYFLTGKKKGKREEEKEINQEKRRTGMGERKEGMQKRSDRKISG